MRAPTAGQVLAIHAREGERVGRDGILELGHPDQMYARTRGILCIPLVNNDGNVFGVTQILNKRSAASNSTSVAKFRK